MSTVLAQGPHPACGPGSRVTCQQLLPLRHGQGLRELTLWLGESGKWGLCRALARTPGPRCGTPLHSATSARTGGVEAKVLQMEVVLICHPRAFSERQFMCDETPARALAPGPGLWPCSLLAACPHQQSSPAGPTGGLGPSCEGWAGFLGGAARQSCAPLPAVLLIFCK